MKNLQNGFKRMLKLYGPQKGAWPHAAHSSSTGSFVAGVRGFLNDPLSEGSSHRQLKGLLAGKKCSWLAHPPHIDY